MQGQDSASLLPVVQQDSEPVYPDDAESLSISSRKDCTKAASMNCENYDWILATDGLFTNGGV